MHFHNRTAMANLNHIIGVEEGVRIVHSAISTLANGVSMPSTEVTSTTCAGSATRSRSTTAASPRSPSTSARLADDARLPPRRPGRVPGGERSSSSSRAG